MDVYIKGMEMPKRCGECPCFHAENPMYCQAVKADKNKKIIAPYGKPRPDWCPLLPLPNEHGALVDFESLDVSLYLPDVGYLSDYQQGWNDAMHRIINSGKIIIPAEEGET